MEHKLQAAYVALVAVVGQRFLWREPGVSLLASRASLRWRPTRKLLLCSRNPWIPAAIRCQQRHRSEKPG